MGQCLVASTNEAQVISGLGGTRIAVGTTAWQWWCCEQSQLLSLELLTLRISSKEAETTKGVRVNVTSTAQVRVRALVKDEASSGDASAVRWAPFSQVTVCAVGHRPFAYHCCANNQTQDRPASDLLPRQA